MEQGATTDRFSGPLINRVSRGGVDPIPFIFFLSLPSPSLFSRYKDLATAVLVRVKSYYPEVDMTKIKDGADTTKDL
jgi:hypothetical protein